MIFGVVAPQGAGGAACCSPEIQLDRGHADWLAGVVWASPRNRPCADEKKAGRPQGRARLREKVAAKSGRLARGLARRNQLRVSPNPPATADASRVEPVCSQARACRSRASSSRLENDRRRGPAWRRAALIRLSMCRYMSPWLRTPQSDVGFVCNRAGFVPVRWGWQQLFNALFCKAFLYGLWFGRSRSVDGERPDMPSSPTG